MMSDPRRALDLTRQHESSAANTFRLVPDPPVFVRGDGPHLYTQDGARYLDLVCGSATTSLGHGHPAHKRAIDSALATGVLHTGTRLPSPFRAALYERLVSILPPGLDTIQLVNSGAEAIEAAIKAAQYATGRHRLVAFEGGYHGRTLGALSLTSGERIRKPFPSLEQLVDILPYPGQSRSSEGPLSAVDCLEALARTLERRKAEHVLPALILIEAVQAVAGIIGPDIAFLRGVEAIARTHGVLLAIDEIWNGFGRAGRWFAFEQAGLTPDLVVMGKALSGGLPLSAVGGRSALLKAWPPGMHTSTFQGNPLSCAMAAATIDTIRSEALLDHVTQRIAPALADALGPLADHPAVAGVRIVGAQAAIAFRRADDTPNPDRAVELQKSLQERHILAYGGGRAGECLMLVPPINIPLEVLQPALETVVELATAQA